MSLLAATQIPRPSDEQAFERASIALWRHLLEDPNVQRNGRRGQRQNGVDLFGIRKNDASWYVGVQCKLKSEGQLLTESEIKSEVQKALTFRPQLREYFITTTAPDDVRMQELARAISVDLANDGIAMRVSVWGWNTLEERISEHAEARKLFDPTFDPFSEALLKETRAISTKQDSSHTEVISRLSRVETLITSQVRSLPGEGLINSNGFDTQLDAEIDQYRELMHEGKPQTALLLLQKLLARVEASANGRIIFRIKANIGHCYLAQGLDTEAAELLLSAYGYCPTEPKAIANKVLGLLLLGEWRQALALGRPQLEADPTNEWLAGYLIQAASYDDTVNDPVANIPEALRSTESVHFGIVQFLRRRGTPQEWWSAARAALDAYPTREFFIRCAAEADLEEIVSDEQFQRSRCLPQDKRQRLQKATNSLLLLWDKRRAQEGPFLAQDSALCANVMGGFYALNELNRAVEIGQQGLTVAPDDQELTLRTVAMALETGSTDLAESLVQKLPVDSSSSLMRFRIHANRGNWAAIVQLCQEERFEVPRPEEHVVATTRKIAEMFVTGKQGDDRKRTLLECARFAATDPRASIVVADIAHRCGLAEVSEAAFDSALSGIDAHSHLSERFMVANYAARHDRSGTAVDLLLNYVAEDHDTVELQTLARSLGNDTPVRQRALDFFERLPAHVAQLPFYLNALGLMHFNRGALLDSEFALRRAASIKPTLDNYIPLIHVLHRLDRNDELQTLAREIDLNRVEGTPAQKLFLAQVLLKYGDRAVALAYGYSALQSAKDDEEAALRYLGLLMGDPKAGDLPHLERVSVDTWVQLEDEHWQTYSFVIEGDRDRPSEDVFSPSHPTAAAVIGLRIGDEFAMPTSFGFEHKWKVAEIKHKYLHALHDIMEHFQNRFPHSGAIGRVTVEDGDLTPILDRIKRHSESRRRFADLYQKQRCPLNLLASRQGLSSIGFAQYIRFLGLDIRSCLGTEGERAAGRELIRNSSGKGAVLDTYTAWTAAELNVLGVLKRVFGYVIVPQSTVDELKKLRDEYQFSTAESMSVAWHNGAFVRQVTTAEDAAERRAYVSELVERIVAECEVRPVVANNNPSESARIIHEYLGTHILDSAHLAGVTHILVSDDMHMREYCAAACSVQGVWLQLVFQFAVEMGFMEAAQYVEAITALSARRHGHISLDAKTVVECFRAESENNLSRFRAITHFIGSPEADMKSHIYVVAQALNEIWRENGHSMKHKRAVGILLEQLLRYRTHDWAVVLAYVTRGSITDARDYIRSWTVGHFMDVREVDLAVQRIEDSVIERQMEHTSSPRRSRVRARDAKIK